MTKRLALIALFLVATLFGSLAAACSDDAKQPSAAEVDRTYIRSWCQSLLTFKEDILGTASQSTPYPQRNIDANQRFLDAMSRATPPGDAKSWHDEWIAAGRENLDKLRANDPSAAPDPMDVGPDRPLPDRLLALFSELPECVALSQADSEPTASVGPTGPNSHTNVSAVQVAPGEVRVSFDYTLSNDPQGGTITAITISPLGADGRPLDGYAPVVSPVSRGSGHMDRVLQFTGNQLVSVRGFSVCFTGPNQPDLGCARVGYP